MSRLLSCPDARSWSQMLDGRSSAREQSNLSQHLEDCPDCQQTLEGLTRCDASWSQSGPVQERRRRPALMRAMESLKSAAEQSFATIGQETVDMDLSFLGASDNPQRLGRLGRYEVLDVIGRGGMGIVLRAFHPARNRTVAIKVLAPMLANNATARQRFEREAAVARTVVHDNVVAIYDVSDINGLPFIVMEYVAGISLQERLDRSGPPELEDILRIAMQTAAGLAAAHDQDLIHRDIKPANILLAERTCDVKLTDFGLARAVDDASLTQSGVIAGTPQYMAPEQARGLPLDHRADLFSLGSVLYTMCTGRPPFRAPSTLAVLKRVCDDTPQSIRDLNPDIPASLAEIITTLHSKHPGDRFKSAHEVARLLEKQLRKLRATNSAGPRPERRMRVEMRTPWLMWGVVLAGVAIALLFASTGVGLWLWSSAVERPNPAPVALKPMAIVKQIPAPAKPPPPVVEAPKGTGDPVIDKALDELAELNPLTSREAARRLGALDPKQHRAIVAGKLAGLADVGDASLRREVLRALVIWATEKEIPALIQALKNPDVFGRREVLKGIGKLHDKRTIEPVVINFLDFQTRADATTALRDLGPMAEKEVLGLLDHADVFIRQAAIEILRDIGTQASVPKLQEAVAENNMFVSERARFALTAISARAKN